MSIARQKSVAQKNHFSNLEFIMSLNKYIPSLVLQQLIMREQSADKSTKLPELQPMETVVIFADISGFTNLGEACAEKGPRGNEELAFCINRYMEGMVTNLNQYGGDIIKFVGDAMIVMWPPINRQLSNWQDTRNDTIRRAIQCGQDIQKHMNNLMMLPGVYLSVKIGIGYGSCALLYVGGVFGRSESFTIGEALIQALRSEGQATGGGQIIVSDSCFSHVKEFFKAKELTDAEIGDKFHLVDYKHSGQRVKVQADAMKIRQQFSVEIFASIQQQMQGCVAASVIPYLQIDKEKYGSENRSLTVMFVSLGVELSSASTPEGMNKIQQIVTEVQKQVYRQQGSVNKLLMDDKGSTLICLWGLLPFAHDDDAARAILAGFNMIKTLNKIDGTYCNIGISSGECFSGVVGTSGSRKEFSVLGDIVNLAARIMGTVKGSKAKNEIRCDLNTRLLASNFFDFQYTQHYELKGKSISMPFYKPSNPYEKYELAKQKFVPPEVILNVHVNPLYLERNTESKMKVKTNSFQEILMSLVSDITDYFSEENNQWPYMAVIKGEIGSGKTTFARNLIDDLQNANEFAPYLRANKGKLPIFTSAVNAETQLQFLNAWKPIIQMLFIFFCKRMGLKKESFLADVLSNSNNLDKVDLLCEITGVDKYVLTQKRGAAFAQQLREIEQVEPIRSPIAFVQRPDYTEQQKSELIDFLTQFIKCMIGEENDISEWHSIMDQSRQRSRQLDDSFMDKPPFMIFIDNAHNMCPTSWQLLQNVLDESYRLVVVLLVQSDDMDRMKIDSLSIPVFEKVYDELVERLDVVEKDLPRLTQEQLNEVIKSYGQKYKMSYKKEMDDMTKILDYSNTLKDDEMGARQKALLTQKWQLQYQMNHIDQDILRVVVTKCRGNPLLCFQYFINLLHNHFIEIQPDGLVMATSKFDHCMIINDWTAVPVPRLAMKINTQLLDSFYYSISSKDAKNQRPGEIQACTTSIVLLKAASVLGEEFELKALKYISPLSKSSNNSKRVEEAIRLLEQRDFIEIVDETDQKNCVCRFNKCFLRESVYQVLIYKSCKRDIHERTEKYIQQSPSLTSKQDNSILTEQLLQHMLLAQDAEQEKDLVYERRNALVVLRVQNIINMNPRSLVLKECLYKQGDAINKNVQKRICSLTQFALKWYHNDQREYEEDKFMGMVKLPFIYDVVKSKQAHNERPSFMISVTMYYDKKNEEKGKRDIFFSCDTPETRDKWMIAIDYLKTRAIYDAYAKKNTLANFFAQGNEEEHQGADGDHEERDHSNLLYDFGDQLKNSTMGGSQQIFKSALANSKLNNSLVNDRKSSVFRMQVSGVESTQPKVTAYDMLPKLKLLYKVSMASFTHHLHRQGFKSKAVVSKASRGGKQQAVGQQEDQQMQLPQSINWNIKGDIEDIMAQEPLLYTADRNGTQYSSRPGSEYNRNESNASTLYHQNSHNSSENRRTTQRQKSSDNIPRENNITRRSSSISADQVQRAQQNLNTLPANNLIKELPDESDESEKGGTKGGISRKNSKTRHQLKGRQSVEVNQADMNHLQRVVGMGSVHNSATKQLSINNYRNSEDSSLTPNSTPPLTTNQLLIGNQVQPPSSQVLSASNPTQGKDEGGWNKIPDYDDNDDDEENDEEGGFISSNIGAQGGNPPLIDRENRQTFASSHAGKDEAYPPTQHPSDNQPGLQQQQQNQQHYEERESSCSTQNFQKHQSGNHHQGHHHRKANSSMQQQWHNHQEEDNRANKNNPRETGKNRHHKNYASMMSGSDTQNNYHHHHAKQDSRAAGVDSFRHSSNEYSNQSKSQFRGGPQPRISGGVGEQQPSIGKEADRRELSMIHQQNANDSRMYPDLIGNSMTLDPLINAPQQDKDQQSISAEAPSGSQESQNQKLISTISSMIKQKLDMGIKTMERMAEQQQQLQEQMNLQQQQLLNSSFHTQAMMQQQQAFASHQQSVVHTPTTNQFSNHQLPQLGVGATGVPPPGQQPHLVKHSVSALMPQAQYSAMMTSTGHQPAELFTPVRDPGGSRLYSQHAASPYYNIYSAANNTAFSEMSQQRGGITSKRREKFLLDSASQPIQSKQDMTSEDEEPRDPMMNEDSGRLHEQQYHHQQPISFELDLRDHQHQHPPKQNSRNSKVPGEQPQTSLNQQHDHQQQLRAGQMQPRDQLQQLRSFHVPSSTAMSPNNNLIGGQLSDTDNHTDHEAMIQSHQRRQLQQPNNMMMTLQPTSNNDVRTPPMYQATGAYMANRQNAAPNMPNAPAQLHQQYSSSHQQNDYHDQASVMTLKPTYPGTASEHLSTNRSDNKSRIKQQQQYQSGEHQHHGAGQQFSMKQQQVNAQQQIPIKFADQPLVFPPPENWTETQYAMYEEPLSASQYKTLKSVTRAMAVRDSSDLRSQQILIPRNAEVQVLEILPQAQVCKIEYQGRIGIFKLQDFVNKEPQSQYGSNQMYQSHNDSVNLSLQMATNARASPNKHQKAHKPKKEFSGIPTQSQHQHARTSRESKSPIGPSQYNDPRHGMQMSGTANLTPQRTVSIDVNSGQSVRNALNKAAIGSSQSHRGPVPQVYQDSSHHNSQFQQQQNKHMMSGSRQQNTSQNNRTAKRSMTMMQGGGVIQDSTIEQMSSINGYDDDDNHRHQLQEQEQDELVGDNSAISSSNVGGGNLNSAHRNFFKDEPEKHLSKQMRGLTAKELANYSKQFLEEDKQIHKQNNLKMVERQKRKAQIARRQNHNNNQDSSAKRK